MLSQPALQTCQLLVELAELGGQQQAEIVVNALIMIVDDAYQNGLEAGRVDGRHSSYIQLVCPLRTTIRN